MVKGGGGDDDGDEEKSEEDSDADSDEDSEDEFEDEESEDEDTGKGMQINNKIDPFEAIPDIGKHFEKLKVPHKHEKLNGGECPRNRIFYKLLKELKNISGAVSPRSEAALKRSGLLNLEYPHKQRLCIIVDRRREDTELFMYEPDIENEFPRDYVDEWYFESSTKCLIPGKGQRDRIIAKDSRNGYVFNLSFHVEESNIIKCYLYTRASILRFLPEDIFMVFPQLFNMSRPDNDNFVKREKKQGKNGKMQYIKLKDSLFESFRYQTSDAYQKGGGDNKKKKSSKKKEKL